MKASILHSGIPLLALLVVSSLTYVPATGFFQSYTRTGGTINDPGADLTSLSSTDPGGRNVTVVFILFGPPDLQSSQFSYYATFDNTGCGLGTRGCPPFVGCTWNGIDETCFLNSGPQAQHAPVSYARGGGNSTATLSVSKSLIASPSSFCLAATALGPRGSWSELGCGVPRGTGSSGYGANLASQVSQFGSFFLIVFAGMLIFAIAVVILVARRARKPRPPPTAWQAATGSSSYPPTPPPPPANPPR